MSKQSYKQITPRAYKYYESRFGDGYNRRCIDGHITNDGNCVGYCILKKHPGFLTQELYEKHDCGGKKCNYFSSKDKNKKPKPVIPASSADDKLADDIFIHLIISLSEYEGIKLLSVKKNDSQDWIARYVTVTSCIPLSDIAEDASTKFGVNVVFEKLDCDYQKAVELIFSLKI